MRLTGGGSRPLAASPESEDCEAAGSSALLVTRAGNLTCSFTAAAGSAALLLLRVERGKGVGDMRDGSVGCTCVASGAGHPGSSPWELRRDGPAKGLAATPSSMGELRGGAGFEARFEFALLWSAQAPAIFPRNWGRVLPAAKVLSSAEAVLPSQLAAAPPLPPALSTSEDALPVSATALSSQPRAAAGAGSGLRRASASSAEMPGCSRTALGIRRQHFGLWKKQCSPVFGS